MRIPRPRFSMLALLLCLGAGCASTPDTRIVLDDGVARPARSVVLFFVDGLDRRRFDAMSADGQLPNLTRRFVRGGIGVEHAIVSMPSVTYANAVSLITGRLPGHHGQYRRLAARPAAPGRRQRLLAQD